MNNKISAIFLALSICSSAQALHFGKKATATVCFTPGGQCEAEIIHEIDAAQMTIKLQAYELTSSGIRAALADAKSRNVFIKVIVDKSQVNDTKNGMSAANFLKGAKIPVWIDTKPTIAHNKVLLIDEDIVGTGSFNFSFSAQNKNAENWIMITDRNLYRVYDRNFEKRLKESRKYE